MLHSKPGALVGILEHVNMNEKQAPQPLEPLLLRISQVVQLTSLGRTLIYQMILRGEFPPPRKVGRCSLWPTVAVREWVETGTWTKAAVGGSEAGGTRPCGTTATNPLLNAPDANVRRLTAELSTLRPCGAPRAAIGRADHQGRG